MVPKNVLRRVFHIKIGDITGTCFVIEVDDKQYFVTAKHVIVHYVQYGIKIQRDNKWIPLTVQYLGYSPDADVAVFTVSEEVVDYHSIPIVVDNDSGKYFLSQDVYFLGYPWGSFIEAGIQNSFYPLPYVKKAIISAFDFQPQNKSIIFLDGHNNEGFSGGPVTYTTGEPEKAIAHIIGVVSGYRAVSRNIHDGNTNELLDNFQYKENTGIIISYSIQYALDIIAEISTRGVKLGTSSKM